VSRREARTTSTAVRRPRPSMNRNLGVAPSPVRHVRQHRRSSWIIVSVMATVQQVHVFDLKRFRLPASPKHS